MTEIALTPDAAPMAEAGGGKTSKWPLLIGLVMALLLGGGGFYATWSGLILAPSHDASGAGPSVTSLPDISFVALEPIIISLGPNGAAQHLKFVAQLEVVKAHADEVVQLTPRILDVLNGYLRAVDPKRLEDPGAITLLRAQMLRRVQIVTGEGRIRDLLITEFILN